MSRLGQSRPTVAIRGAAFRQDKKLLNQMEALHSDAFTAESLNIFRQRISASNALYYIAENSGQLLGFFLVSHSQIFFDGAWVNAMFCGPMVVNNDVKGTGVTLASMLYAALQDSKRRETLLSPDQRKMDTVVWGISAAPSALKGAYTYLCEVNPRPDGTYDQELLPLVKLLRHQVTAGTDGETMSPFLLKRYFNGRLSYNNNELRRIKAATRARALPVFSLFEFDETEGDGILFIGRIPAGL